MPYALSYDLSLSSAERTCVNALYSGVENLLGIIVIFLIIQVKSSDIQPFIYFQF